MEIEIENWLKQMENELVLTKSTRNAKSYYHFNTEAKFIFPKLIVADIKNNYHPKNEEGGYINFRPTVRDGVVVLEAVNVEWVPNEAKTKHNSYRIYTETHKAKERAAYVKHLFPLRFHTHPMDAKERMHKSKRLLEIIDTSEEDKELSFELQLQTKNARVILPDILIVWDVNHLDSFFLGIYNGLIAPLGFVKQRNKVASEFNESIKKDLVNWVDGKSDIGQVGIAVGTIATVVAAFCYPHVSSKLYQYLKNQAPIVAISSQNTNLYFGFARVKALSEFTILIPKATQELINDNEVELKEAMKIIELRRPKS